MNHKRIKGEPDDCYRLFVQFCKLDKPRNLSKMISSTGMSLSALKRRSSTWHWIERVRSYDSAILERTLEGELKGIEQVAKKEVVSHRKKVSTLLDMTWSKIVVYLKEDVLHPREVVKLFVDLLKLGISKEELYVKLEEHRQAADLSMLTDQQLAALDEINEAIKVE